MRLLSQGRSPKFNAANGHSNQLAGAGSTSHSTIRSSTLLRVVASGATTLTSSRTSVRTSAFTITLSSTPRRSSPSKIGMGERFAMVGPFHLHSLSDLLMQVLILRVSRLPAFQTAVTLAIYQAHRKPKPPEGGRGRGAERWITLERTHLEDVVNMSNNFKSYIHRTRDDSPSTEAKQRRLRDDRYGLEGMQRERKEIFERQAEDFNYLGKP